MAKSLPSDARSNLLALSMLSLATMALAQSPPKSADPGSAAAVGSDTVPASAATQTITVTADRRAESVKRVPSSVTALSGAKLEEIGAARLDDFIGLVPGLNAIGGRPGNQQLTLRGISSGGDAQSATVGTYIDDIPIGSSTALAVGSRVKPDLDAFDLERVEVLRGPQGTLYGANTLGGLLKYVTTAPDPKSLQGFGRVEVMAAKDGGTGYGVNAGLNAPLTKDSAIRVSAFSRKEPGHIDNVDPAIGKKDVNDLRTSGARLAYAAKPTEGFRLRATFITQEFKTGADSTEDINRNTGVQIEGPLKQRRYTSEAGKQNFDLGALSMDFDLAGGTLLSVTSFNKVKQQRGQDWTPLDGLGFGDPSVPLANDQGDFSTEKTTQEFRFTSASSESLEWLLGGFWTREKTRLSTQEFGLLTQTQVAPPPNDNFFSQDLTGTYNQTSVYGNARWFITKDFDFAFGARVTRDKTDATNKEGGLFGSGATTVLNQSANFTSFMVAPRYRLDATTTVYGRAASASRPGGPNTVSSAAVTAGARTAFDPDELISYELGLKTTLLGGKLGLDVALFRIDWKDVQLRTTVGNFAFIGNGGKARSQGVELTLAARPLDALNLNFNAAYTDAKLVNDAPGVGGLAGVALPNAPKLSAALGADWYLPGFAGGQSYVGASVRYMDDREENYIRGRGRPRLTLPSYSTVDLRAGLRWASWDLNFYVKNATNERVVETVTTNFAPSTATIGRTRTIGVYATVRTF